VIEPPVAGVGTRRVWSDSKGDLWISEWSGGRIARYSPATGKWDRYAIPGQDKANLYAVYVDNKDVVWVSNWADNKIWSFDPKTNKFTSVSHTKSGADVRQIAGANGSVYIPESGNASVMVINTGGSQS
jgi:virginiamycin B lyase